MVFLKKVGCYLYKIYYTIKTDLFWKIRYYICKPYYYIKTEIAYRKKIKKLREQDPFIYN